MQHVELKRREVERSQARVDMACNALAQREVFLRERQAELAAALHEKEELDAAGGDTVLETNPVTKGLFHSPLQ